MPLKKKPVTGMKDILPGEMEIRDYVTGSDQRDLRNVRFCTILRLPVWSISRTCPANRAERTRS